jgi:hypothetical protein
MNSEAILLHSDEPSPIDVRLRQLVELMGITCKTLDALRLDADLDRARGGGLCILASAGAIFRWCHDGLDHRARIDHLRQNTRFLFVYGFAPDRNATSIAASLTDGQISDVQRFDRTDFNYEVASSHRQFTKEFSGLTFGPVSNEIDFGFVCSTTSGEIRPLVSIAGLPFFAFLEKGGCTTFLLACKDIVDIQEETDGSLDAARYFSRLLPAAMFLKSVFKRQCWQSRHRFANFIIDDPPLKHSYGYLNYKDLLLRMDKSNFATTIAFIPWNYRRTQNAVAELFRQRPDRLSLCVHGCDHIHAELATTNVGTLNRRIQVASNRMNAHRVRTGLRHSEVMVFPQGRFSPQALKVLKSNNYLAAINSSATPSIHAVDQPLIVGDFLELAIIRYGGFPLFLRRYPGGLEGFAFDLFFGKPAFVVEHHGYFKDGGSSLVEFIGRLNSLGGLEWTSLNEIMTKSYLERDISPETTLCRIYANRQMIENPSTSERTFILTKSLSGDVPIESVFIGGQRAQFEVVKNLVQFGVKIPAKQSATVNVVYKNQLPCAEGERGIVSASRVWTRRMLSEFRDNFLCMDKFFLIDASAAKMRGSSRHGTASSRT